MKPPFEVYWEKFAVLVFERPILKELTDSSVPMLAIEHAPVMGLVNGICCY